MERTWTPDQAFPICGLKLLSDRRFVLNESTLSWWDPDSVRNYRSAEARLPDGEYLFILLDLDRDEAITILSAVGRDLIGRYEPMVKLSPE